MYFLPIIVQLIEMRIMRWARHVACMRRGEVYRGFWWGNLRERDHLGDPEMMDLQEVECWGMD
jgi:hypothetical protein